jgi:transposase
VPDLVLGNKVNVEHPSMSNHNVISVDLAKNVFQICVLNQHNKVVFNKKVKRSQLLDTVQQLDASRVVMEACYSSNHWGRQFQSLGYQVDLIPPHHVKPFLVGNKNDHNDALAIAEAAQRPKTTTVAIKSLEQQDIQSLYRIRERLMRARTAVANQLRGLLAEYGVIVEKKVSSLRQQVPLILEDAENGLTVVSRSFVHALYQELMDVDVRILNMEKTAQTLLSANDDYHRLQSIPGIGPVVSGHMMAAIHDPKLFKNGRSMAAWLGLTPQQIASGDHSRMVGISKRGNNALRRQLIHGARAVINWCGNKEDKLSLWLQQLLKTKHRNKVTVALANKLARIAWAVLMTKEPFNVDKLCAC